MRFILLSGFLISNLVAQTANIYPDNASPATPAAPPTSQSSSTAPAPATTPDTSPTETSTPDSSTAPAAIPGETEYTVVAGDSLWRIAHRHHVSVASIKALNQLTSNKLKIGLVLRIPPPPTPKVKVANEKKAGTEVRKALAADGQPIAPVAPPTPPKPPTLQERFMSEIKQIASNKIPYNHEWIPPGEQEAWPMDCSNTVRWLYKKVQSTDIPRTASDQYDQLLKANKVWKAPRTGPEGLVDLDYLDQHLQVGDLLFWENTYKPDREPPITHVALYLGKDEQGRRLIAESNSSPGLYNTAGSGPDVHIFDPNAPSGGYTTGLFGWTHVKGEFVGYGRPLDTPAANPPTTTPKVSANIQAPN